MKEKMLQGIKRIRHIGLCVHDFRNVVGVCSPKNILFFPFARPIDFLRLKQINDVLRRLIFPLVIQSGFPLMDHTRRLKGKWGCVSATRACTFIPFFLGFPPKFP